MKLTLRPGGVTYRPVDTVPPKVEALRVNELITYDGEDGKILSSRLILSHQQSSMFNKYHSVEITKRFSSIIHHVCASVLASS